MKTIQSVGKRKCAVARATLSPGNGTVRINSQLLQFYEPGMYRQKIEEPMIIAGDSAKIVDINIRVMGGGIASQSEAARLAVAKALVIFDKKLRLPFLAYDRTLLVADVRQKEEHKPNRHGKARSKTQKSYR
jgi:small subunit ribosomal protein S9